jgi:hypothetical protein
MNRREFLIQIGAAAAGCAAGGILTGCAQMSSSAAKRRRVSILCDPEDPIASLKPSQWAVDQLRKSLVARGFVVRVCRRLEDADPADLCVIAAGRSSQMTRDFGVLLPSDPESLTIAPGRLGQREILLVSGSDVRGLVYGLTEIADAVALAGDPQVALRPSRSVTERPANRVRSVMRLFASDVEDKGWYNDREFWQRYLSLLAAQRFNRFNLALGLGYDAPSGLRDTYFYFAYPFLLSVPGYDVRATNLPDAERDRNLEMLRFISDEAAARGLQFQLGLWTHAYRWTNSPNANHVIEGLTPQTQATYSRDALTLLLKECPNITGVTFRIHGESGVAEGSYDLWKTIFDGCVRSGRRVEIDMHAKGMDQGTIDAAIGTGLPVTISPKFWAEHMGLPYHQAAIRATEMPTRERGGGLFAQSAGARSFLRYGYGDLLKEDRRYAIVHRIWPGTQRLLLWGDPTFAAAYGRAFSFCGSQGCEIFDPMSFKGRKGSGLPGGRDGYADASLRPAEGDFEKYRYTYRLWGRMLFNPDADPQTWQRQLRQDYGPAAGAAGKALASASRILPLFTTAHTPAAANNNYWPEMYVNMSILGDSRAQPYSETPSPRRFGMVSPLDPQLFARVDDYADELLKGQVCGKYSPVEVAQWMEDFAQTAAENLSQAEVKAIDRNAPVFRRFAIDVRAQIGLGNFFGRKLRAAVLYRLYEQTANGLFLEEAIKSYRAARQSWASLAEATTGVYVKDVTYGEGWFQRGHWSDRLAAIDKDIAAMEQKAAAPSPQLAIPGLPSQKGAVLIREVLGRPPQHPVQSLAHTSPPSFQKGQPVLIELGFARKGPQPTAAQLYYRHANQAEMWQATPMQIDYGRCRVTLPGEYTDSPYPLEYYFEVTDKSGRRWLYPGLGPSLTIQPYYVIHSTANRAAV